jgi:hypothetical protein
LSFRLIQNGEALERQNQNGETSLSNSGRTSTVETKSGHRMFIHYNLGRTRSGETNSERTISIETKSEQRNFIDKFRTDKLRRDKFITDKIHTDKIRTEKLY